MLRASSSSVSGRFGSWIGRTVRSSASAAIEMPAQAAARNEPAMEREVVVMGGAGGGEDPC